MAKVPIAQDQGNSIGSNRAPPAVPQYARDLFDGPGFIQPVGCISQLLGFIGEAFNGHLRSLFLAPLMIEFMLPPPYEDTVKKPAVETEGVLLTTASFGLHGCTHSVYEATRSVAVFVAPSRLMGRHARAAGCMMLPGL